MALSAAQRVSVRRYMGYPLSPLDTDLENAMSNVDAAGAASEAELVTVLTALASVETQISALHEAMVAVQIDKIRIDPARALITLYMDGRRWVQVLRSLLGMPPRRDVFSAPEYVT